MEIYYAAKAREDRDHWERTNKVIIARIDALIEDIQERPFSGLGKPEPLKFQWSGFWSRRINAEHRLAVAVATCRQ